MLALVIKALVYVYRKLSPEFAFKGLIPFKTL